MKTDLFEIADSYFSAHPEAVTSGWNSDFFGTDNNPFIRSAQIDGKSYRTIQEKMVLYLTKNTGCENESILVSPHQAAKVTLPGVASVELHRHQFYELLGVLDGQLDVQMEHARKRYFPGDFCLMNQSVFHSEVYSGDFKAIYISIRPDFFEELMSSKESSHFETFTQSAKRNIGGTSTEDSLDFTLVKSSAKDANMAQMNRILSDILTELLERHTGYKDIVVGNLKRLFAHMQHTDTYSCVNTQYEKEKKSVYQDMLAYIHQNRRKITRRELSAAMNYNSNYLADIFRKNMGISLSAYIRDICMQEAARLLLNTDLPIHVIAGSVGYENRTVFYQHFQEKYHMTPSQYRESL